jgi:hypothetical protein
MNYPEHEKLKEVQEKSQAIGDFLEWLGYEKDVTLCEYFEPTREERREEGAIAGYLPTNKKKMDLLAEYFDIDLNKIEQEKRQMLDELRRKQ